MNYEPRICIICGREFEPHTWHQKCCCLYCTEVNLKNKAREHAASQPVKAKGRMYRLKHPHGVCKLCGKPVFKNPHKVHDSTKMHDECVYKDVINTLKMGKTINSTQASRLAGRGWSVREFKIEHWEEIIYGDINK